MTPSLSLVKNHFFLCGMTSKNDIPPASEHIDIDTEFIGIWI